MISGEALAAAWFNEDWAYRKTITVVGPVINGPHADFPLLVSISSDANLVASAQPNGGDILFTSSDGTTKLAHEIESYSSGTLVAWVKIPAPGIDNGTVIYMYYGDADYATNGDQWETDGSTWDSDYEGVWHLSEDPSPSVSTDCAGGPGTKEVCDSTSNNADGDTNGTMTSGDQVAGQVGGSLDFDGLDDYIDVTDRDFGDQDFTFCFWLYPKDNDSGTFSLYRNAVGGGEEQEFIGIRFYSGGQINVYDGDSDKINSIATLSADTAFYHVCLTKTQDNNWEIFIDGDSDNTRLASTYSPSGLDVFTIASRDGVNLFTGIIDELRVSSSIRSAGWIKTSYNNQDNPSSFLTVSEQVSIPIPTMTEWGMIIFMVLAGIGSIYYLKRKTIKV